MLQKATHLLSPELLAASGKVPYSLTNDYLFRIVLQKNENARKGLISSVLHINPESISSVMVLNPILLGKIIQDKEYHLDLLVSLNDSSRINIEMQIFNWKNWPERSLSYLCRLFDSLEKGDSYVDISPVIHIGFLDFTLFPDYPDFFSSYQFLHSERHYIYSDKLKLYVVDLSQIQLATDNDKFWGLDQWARLLKATTWEEIKMLAAKNEFLNETSNTMCSAVQDFLVEENCRAREEYYNLIKTQNSVIAEREAVIEKMDDVIAKKDASIAEKDVSIAEKDAQLLRLQKLLEENNISY